MIDPWVGVGWAVLAVALLVYVGGLVLAWREWGPDGDRFSDWAAAVGLTVFWPWALGALLITIIKERA